MNGESTRSSKDKHAHDTIVTRSKHDATPTHSSYECHVQVPTIVYNLPPTSAAGAREMFNVTDDGKLRVRDPLHKQFKGSQVKALDRVIPVNGNVCDPRALRRACVSDVTVELKLQRDLHKNC